MTLVNREVVARLLNTGEPLAKAANRAVGKTTAAILGAFAEAIKNPHVWVPIADPDVKKWAQCQQSCALAVHLAARLELRHMHFKVDGTGVHVMSKFAEPI